MIQIKRKENSVRNLRLIGGWFVRTRTMAEGVPLMVRGDTNHGGEHKNSAYGINVPIY